MAQKVLLYTQDSIAARAELLQLGGRILHQFGSECFVAELPDSVDVANLVKSSPSPASPLDNATRLAVEAWNGGPNNIGAATASSTGVASAEEGLAWDATGFSPPRQLDDEDPTAPPGAVRLLSTDTVTSRYLIGSVAVGIVMVSSVSGSEVMSDVEKTLILEQLQLGLDFLANVEPLAEVSFAYDIRPVVVDVPPGPYAGAAAPYEAYERDWRDAALETMGFRTGHLGYQDYANYLRVSYRSDWAYVVFVTKYRLGWFAYAGRERVVMGPNFVRDDGSLSTNWGGWGLANVHRIFAHETGHIFGADDEYGNCNCGSTPGTGGHLRIPNNNCRTCFPPGVQAECLMNANTLSLCQWSKGQIGWHPALLTGGTSLLKILAGYPWKPC
jgi:hypothetical protein